MLATVLAGIAVMIAGGTALTVLALLGRREFQYATKADLDEVTERLRVQGNNQAKLFRYLEAVDDSTSGRGHQVLGVWVPGDNSEA